MSGRLVGAVLQDRLGDAPARQRQGLRAVLVVLAEASRDGSVAWPSIATIAERSLISPRQVSRLLTQLEELGRISVSGSRSGGRAKATRWRVTPRPAEAVNHDTTPPNRVVETMTPRTGNHDTQMSSEPYEPKIPLSPPSGLVASPSLPGLGVGEQDMPALGVTATRARGRNPRSLGSSSRALGRNPRSVGSNPRALTHAEEQERRRSLDLEAAAIQAEREAEEAERAGTQAERLALARAALERVRSLPVPRSAAGGRR